MLKNCIVLSFIATVVMIGACRTQVARAGHIGPGLDARLQVAGPDELLQVVIRPIGTMTGTELKKQVAARYATRANQHRAAVEALQATSDAAQRPVLISLNSDQYAGRVFNVQEFWIDNVITAEMTPSAISELSHRPDVDEILLMPKVELVRPIAADATGSAAAQGMQNGIKSIFADSVWALGYTGHGRLVASLDTGVKGDHEMLSAKWRGNNGGSVRESWFDPVYGDPVPRVYSGSGAAHGTQVMGIMVGGQPGAIDTFSVCPDCQWISAAVIDIPCPTAPTVPCGNLFEGLQWVADPDGDPLTDGDVPDAVANPWGAMTKNCANTGVGCDDIFWNAIDNIEAAGAVMIFAAGNEGECGGESIRNPANRATSETNAFSVGMVNTNTSIVNPPIDPRSSFGPSDCDHSSTKPELVAPGVNIFSTLPNNGIGFGTGDFEASGTSFSTPHVAAAVALLREYNPDATADEIKQALLDGARNLGPVGPDNQYGHGMLNVLGALRALPPSTQPNLTVVQARYVLPSPGQAAAIVLVLKNAGQPASGISVTIDSDDPRITILDGTASFPDLPNAGDTASNQNDPIDVTVSSDLLSGERVPITVSIAAAGGYTRTMNAVVRIGPAQSDEIYTHNAGAFQMTVSSFGAFGLQANNLNPRKGEEGYGVGYLYLQNPAQSLFEGAFLVATGPTKVSDAVRNLSGLPDVDFLVDPGGRIAAQEPGEQFAEETRSAFSDAYAENPIGLFIEQRTWVSTDPDEDDYLTCEYTIHNRSGDDIVGLYAGLFFDWDMPYTVTPGVRDDGDYDAASGTGWMNDRAVERFRGLCVVSPMGTTSYHFFDNIAELYDGFTEQEKWSALIGGFDQVNRDVDTSDASHLIGTGPYTIPADSFVTVAFAIIGSFNRAGLLASAQTARTKYNAVVSVSPLALNFSAIAGGDDPAPQTFRITNATEEAATFAASTITGLASVDPTSGEILPTAFTNITVDVPLGDRTAGIYRDTVLVTTSSFTLPSAKVAITLDVSSPNEASVDPNPFNPMAVDEVRLRLRSPATTGTTARVYDLGGVLVRDLSTAVQSGGSSFTWNGRTDDNVTVADGVYLCHVDAPGSSGFTQVFKIAVKKE